MAVYKDEEKGTWYAKFRYTDWTGKARSTTKRGFKTKREAKAYEMDFKRQSSDMPDMTIEELCKRYLSAMKPRWKKSTLAVQTQSIEAFIIPTLGNLTLASITTKTIVDWQNWLLSKGLSDYTANMRNATLSTLLNFAVRMEWITRNPASTVRRIGHVTRRQDFWTLDEYMRFLEAGQGSHEYEKYALCFDILFYSGIRAGEFLGLGKESFDFEKNQIVILHQCNHYNGDKVPLKNRQSYRRITMPVNIMERIKRFMNSLYEVPEVRMFGVSRTTLSNKVRSWSTKAGLHYINLHGFRHSNASYMISLGIPITVISRRLGHKSPKMTLDTYSHMYTQEEESAAEMMEMSFVGQTVVKEKK